MTIYYGVTSDGRIVEVVACSASLRESERYAERIRRDAEPVAPRERISGITPHEAAVYRVLRDSAHPLLSREVAERAGVARRTAGQHLHNMINLRVVGEAGTYPPKYVLRGDNREYVAELERALTQ